MEIHQPDVVLTKNRGSTRLTLETSALFALRVLAMFPLITALTGGGMTLAEPVLGDRPEIEAHADQADIEAGRMTLQEMLAHGRMLFSARFNTLDGQGRPGSTGAGAPRVADQPTFIRTSSPEAGSCIACHSQPVVGGAGDIVTNAFVLAEGLDPVTFSVSGEFSNERNPPALHGTGPIEMLAREMTTELIAIREEARTLAAGLGPAAEVTRSLVAKGVEFGTITVRGDGKVDPGGIEGIDWDLIIKPFHRKGAVVSVRQFANNAMNHHHGMQSTERFGEGVDADLDGMVDELSAGDITAVALFQAALGTPGIRVRNHPSVIAAVQSGRRLFVDIGCASCHIPALSLQERFFSEPNPYNPQGNMTATDREPVVFDMTKDGPRPRLERTPLGGALVEAFTDLKRHDLNDEDFDHFANEQLPQGTLYGFADPGDFYNVPEQVDRPTREFLTARLWDVGNTGPYGHRGDLTMITEAIHFHGGEARGARDAFFALDPADRDAIVEMLKCLQILPEGSPRVVLVPAADEGREARRGR